MSTLHSAPTIDPDNGPGYDSLGEPITGGDEEENAGNSGDDDGNGHRDHAGDDDDDSRGEAEESARNGLRDGAGHGDGEDDDDSGGKAEESGENHPTVDEDRGKSSPASAGGVATGDADGEKGASVAGTCEQAF